MVFVLVIWCRVFGFSSWVSRLIVLGFLKLGFGLKIVNCYVGSWVCVSNLSVENLEIRSGVLYSGFWYLNYKYWSGVSIFFFFLVWGFWIRNFLYWGVWDFGLGIYQPIIGKKKCYPLLRLSYCIHINQLLASNQNKWLLLRFIIRQHDCTKVVLFIVLCFLVASWKFIFFYKFCVYHSGRDSNVSAYEFVRSCVSCIKKKKTIASSKNWRWASLLFTN